MQPSPRALAFVQGFERLRLVGYLPTPNDRPTIGWGHTGSDVSVGLVWTREQAEKAWENDTGAFTVWLNKQLFGIPTTQGQFDALFSLVYNIGIENLRTSTLLRKHKAGDYAAAAAQFLRWDHQAGRVLPGLTKRRKAERLLYLS
jgi:GH24 family phage-related lysozyme (muramidase)